MKTGALRDLMSDRQSHSLAAALLLLLTALFLPPFQLPRDTYTWLVFLDITQSMDVEDQELDGENLGQVEVFVLVQ